MLACCEPGQPILIGHAIRVYLRVFAVQKTVLAKQAATFGENLRSSV
jgi:hypothetical protein